jgi:hypothetical protein
MYLFHKKASFYGEESLAPHPTPKLDAYSLSAVCDCLFNIFAALIHIRDLSSICNQRAQIAVVTGPTSYGLSHNCCLKLQSFYRLCRDFLCLMFQKTAGKLCVGPHCLLHCPPYHIAYQRHIISYHVTSYHLFSFRKSVQDYIIHMDMEIVIFVGISCHINTSVYNNHMVI